MAPLRLPPDLGRDRLPTSRHAGHLVRVKINGVGSATAPTATTATRFLRYLRRPPALKIVSPDVAPAGEAVLALSCRRNKACAERPARSDSDGRARMRRTTTPTVEGKP